MKQRSIATAYTHVQVQYNRASQLSEENWDTPLNDICNNCAVINAKLNNVPLEMLVDPHIGEHLEFCVTRDDGEKNLKVRKSDTPAFEWEPKRFAIDITQGTITLFNLRCHTTSTNNRKSTLCFEFWYCQELVAFTNGLRVMSHGQTVEKGLGRKKGTKNSEECKKRKRASDDEEESQKPAKKPRKSAPRKKKALMQQQECVAMPTTNEDMQRCLLAMCLVQQMQQEQDLYETSMVMVPEIPQERQVFDGVNPAASPSVLSEFDEDFLPEDYFVNL